MRVLLVATLVPRWPLQYDSTARPTFNSLDKGGDVREKKQELDNQIEITGCSWTRRVRAGGRWAWKVRKIENQFLWRVDVERSLWSDPRALSHHTVITDHSFDSQLDSSGCGFSLAVHSDFDFVPEWDYGERGGWVCNRLTAHFILCVDTLWISLAKHYWRNVYHSPPFYAWVSNKDPP